jgi:murein DD-endopeptidase MepM/ murein hydrolase activator NlpD
MSRRVRRQLRAAWSVAVLIALLMAPATASADSLGDLQVRINQAKQKLGNLASRRQGQQGVVDQTRGVTNGYASQLRQVDQDLLTAIGKLRQAEDGLAKVETEQTALEDSIAEKEAAVEQRAGVYSTRLRALYKFTRVSPLEQLLAAHDFSDALRRIGMMQAVTRVDNRLLGQLRSEHDELLKAREALAQKQAEAVALRDEIEQQRLEAQRRQAAAQATAQAQATAAARAAAAAQATAQAAARITPTPGRPGQSAALPSKSPPALSTRVTVAGSVKTDGLQPSSYGLMWPVPNPVITTEFGERNFAQPFHTGLDMAQDEYTPIRAAADGIVLKQGLAVPGNRSASYGMMIVIGHGTTLSTLYAHLEDKKLLPLVKQGDKVSRGQVIGYIGMTGITSGPHLHFEVRIDDEPKNPRLYLPK